jgi:hypothetical protein
MNGIRGGVWSCYQGRKINVYNHYEFVAKMYDAPMI